MHMDEERPESLPPSVSSKDIEDADFEVIDDTSPPSEEPPKVIGKRRWEWWPILKWMAIGLIVSSSIIYIIDHDPIKALSPLWEFLGWAAVTIVAAVVLYGVWKLFRGKDYGKLKIGQVIGWALATVAVAAIAFWGFSGVKAETEDMARRRQAERNRLILLRYYSNNAVDLPIPTSHQKPAINAIYLDTTWTNMFVGHPGCDVTIAKGPDKQHAIIAIDTIGGILVDMPGTLNHAKLEHFRLKSESGPLWVYIRMTIANSMFCQNPASTN